MRCGKIHFEMKRAPTLSEFPIVLDLTSRAPLWRQLALGLQVALARGYLRPGARLPSSRTLARRLRVSRNTAMAAYQDLVARGLLRGYRGDGTYVIDHVRVFSSSRIWFTDSSGNWLTGSPLP